MSEESRVVPVFSCCSVGIGRWCWVAWNGETEARALAPAMASGYAASADQAEAQAIDRLGPEAKRLPAKWASNSKRGGASAARAPVAKREAGTGGEARPRSRFGRPSGPSGRQDVPTRLAFLYGAIVRDPPEPIGPVAVTRHRIVKQNATKIHVECDPFDEGEWARRGEMADGLPERTPKPRTVAVDRFTLRKEGRFRSPRTQPGLTFYASEDDGIRDVEAALTAKYPWCARLGVRFPCSVDSIKTAYRRLARTSHPDVGGDPAEFRELEQAYRAALAYVAQGGEESP